jgi:hypothetical protein
MKKDPSSISDPQRCGICDTTLTLYPVGFKACPHCQKAVCRSCWRENWIEKRFPSDRCAHRESGETIGVAPVGEKVQSIEWDWQKTLFIGVLALLGIVVLVFLWNLFVF